MASLDLSRDTRYLVATMARPKKDDPYNVEIRARVRPDQKELFEQAAAHAADRLGSGTFSNWLRVVLTKAAKEELGAVESKGGGRGS